MNRTDKIRQFMETQFMFRFGDEVSDDTDLFQSGHMDSFGYIQLVRFIEAEFNLKFSDEDILSNVLVSFSAIDAFAAERTQDVDLSSREDR